MPTLFMKARMVAIEAFHKLDTIDLCLGAVAKYINAVRINQAIPNRMKTPIQEYSLNSAT